MPQSITAHTLRWHVILILSRIMKKRISGIKTRYAVNQTMAKYLMITAVFSVNARNLNWPKRNLQRRWH